MPENSESNRYAVIMAGGRGERFWPLSTSRHPKQVLTLVSDKPMLAMAVDYLEGIVPPERIFVITSEDLVDVTCAAAPELPRENVIGEPFGRDTAAVCALGAALVRARDPEGVFCVMTADHIIGELDVFRAVLNEGMSLAAGEDVLITIGIRPAFPSTGFGYIDAGDRIEREGTVDFLKARRFVEKPDRPTAERYVEAGNFYWNSGMFMWSAATLREALGRHVPPLGVMADRMQAAAGTPEFAAVLRDEYGKLEKISVDYALMERADNIVMAKGLFRWDDVGSWEALRAHFDADADANVRLGTTETVDAAGNLVVAGDRLTALVGVKDLIVVQAEGATLVCHKSRAQDVKQLVAKLKERRDCEALL